MFAQTGVSGHVWCADGENKMTISCDSRFTLLGYANGNFFWDGYETHVVDYHQCYDRPRGFSANADHFFSAKHGQASRLLWV